VEQGKKKSSADVLSAPDMPQTARYRSPPWRSGSAKTERRLIQASGRMRDNQSETDGTMPPQSFF
jgi:hypothetical protein